MVMTKKQTLLNTNNYKHTTKQCNFDNVRVALLNFFFFLFFTTLLFFIAQNVITVSDSIRIAPPPLPHLRVWGSRICPTTHYACCKRFGTTSAQQSNAEFTALGHYNISTELSCQGTDHFRVIYPEKSGSVFGGSVAEADDEEESISRGIDK